MYANPHHQIAKDRVADLHLQAQRHALASAARQGRQPRKHQAGLRVSRFLLIARRRTAIALGAHT